MHFENENTQSVTDNDYSILYEVSAIIKALHLIRIKEIKINPYWKLEDMNCHTVARMVSIIRQELTLVDGLLLGLGLTPEKNKVTVQSTYHSWLRTPDGAIIDPYPMGIISSSTVLLVPTNNTVYTIHAGNLYREDPDVRKYFNVESCWRNARSYIRVLRKHMLKGNAFKKS